MTSRVIAILAVLGFVGVPAEAQVWTRTGPVNPTSCLATNSKNVVFGGTPFSRVWRSTNHGTTWANVRCGSADMLLVDNIVVGANDVLFATVQGSTSGRGGLFRSTDDGLSWVELNIDLRTDTYSTTYVSTKVVDNTTRLFVASRNLDSVGILRYSDDGGETFSEIQKPSLPARGWEFVETFLSPTSDKMFVAVSASKIAWYTSTDRGNTWTVFVPDTQQSERGGYHSMHADRNGVLYLGRYPMAASIYCQNAVVLRSEDDGETWEYLLDGWNTTYDPYNSIEGLAFGQDGDVWVATSRSGVFHSTNGGERWNAANEGLSSGQVGRDIVATPDGHVFLAANEVYVHVEQQTSVDEDLSAIVRETTVYPNPAQDQVCISFDLASDAVVRIDITTVRGEQVGSSYVDRHGVGRHRLSLTTSSLAPGVYIWKVAVQGQIKHGSFVVAY